MYTILKFENHHGPSRCFCSLDSVNTKGDVERILSFFLANTPSSHHALSQEIHFLRPVLVWLEITHEVIGTHHTGETFSPSRISCSVQGNPDTYNVGSLIRSPGDKRE